jgi:hypothetical protein
MEAAPPATMEAASTAATASAAHEYRRKFIGTGNWRDWHRRRYIGKHENRRDGCREHVHFTGSHFCSLPAFWFAIPAVVRAPARPVGRGSRLKAVNRNACG